jgi:hypothetical protein
MPRRPVSHLQLAEDPPLVLDRRPEVAAGQVLESFGDEIAALQWACQVAGLLLEDLDRRHAALDDPAAIPQPRVMLIRRDAELGGEDLASVIGSRLSAVRWLRDALAQLDR